MATVSMVLGIRPDIIRASKIIKLLREELGSQFELIWTGQHYSANLKDIFFEQLNIQPPDVELGVVGDSDAEISGSAIINLYNHLKINRPKVAVFLGDTNSVISSIAAAQLNIPIIHIEGCMRSFDWRMPEEKYRKIVDHLADRIFAYTEAYKLNGIMEGLKSENIIVTGNPIVEVLTDFVAEKLDEKFRAEVLKRRHIRKQEYYVATCHRRENVESRDNLQNIFKLMSLLDKEVVMPLSYRTQQKIKEFQISVPKNVTIEDPIGYGEFISLIVDASGVLTDSGTVVEEACVLNIPCLQMRHSTERPEVYLVGAAIKFDPQKNGNHKQSLRNFKSLANKTWLQPFGDGRASERIALEILNYARSPISGHIPNLNLDHVKKSFLSESF